MNESDEEYKNLLSRRFQVPCYDNGKLGTFKNNVFFLPVYLSIWSYNYLPTPLVMKMIFALEKNDGNSVQTSKVLIAIQ